MLNIVWMIKVNNEYLVCVLTMNIYFLRSNAKKSNKGFLGKIQNTKQNQMYLRDLESWGSLEIVDLSPAYIEYNLI